MTTVKAYVFDGYGTLFDLHSVQDRCEELFPENGVQLTILRQNKHLEYTWLRTLMGRYEDFGQITRDALVFACRTLHLPHSPDQIDKLTHAYWTLRPSEHLPNGLAALRQRGHLPKVVGICIPQLENRRWKLLDD